ncbi:hypothetical protein Tco_1148287, partial [Tanacetum coccineum]
KSFKGNSGLCGLPLTKMCNEHTHKQELESHEEESGFTWEVVMLGYGCGTLLGLVMGYLMLLTRKVKWFNLIADAGVEEFGEGSDLLSYAVVYQLVKYDVFLSSVFSDVLQTMMTRLSLEVLPLSSLSAGFEIVEVLIIVWISLFRVGPPSLFC